MSTYLDQRNERCLSAWRAKRQRGIVLPETGYAGIPYGLLCSKRFMATIWMSSVLPERKPYPYIASPAYRANWRDLP